MNGTGDDACLGWPGRVCAAARRAGHDVTHYNLGIRRNSSDDVAARWRREAEMRLPPEYDGRVVFSFGANDCVADESGTVRVTQERLLGNTRGILSDCVRRWPTLMIGPAPVNDPLTDIRIAAASDALSQVCDDAGVPYLPVFRTLAASAVWAREAALGDGVHPNSGGYTLLAETIGAWTGWKNWFDPGAR